MQSSYRFTPSPDRVQDPTKAPLASPVFTGTVSVPVGTAAAPPVAFTGDSDTGVFHPTADAVGLAAGGVERLRIASAAVSLGGAPGAESLRVVPITNAVNWVQATGSVAGNSFVTVAAQGSDADINLRLQAKGSAGLTLDTSGGRQFRVNNTANATSWVECSGSASGTPTIYAKAGSGDATLILYGAGTAGGVRLDSRIGFFGAIPQTKPTVTGSRSGGTALQSLLTALAALGLFNDASTA